MQQRWITGSDQLFLKIEHGTNQEMSNKKNRIHVHKPAARYYRACNYREQQTSRYAGYHVSFRIFDSNLFVGKTLNFKGLKIQ